ncbi:nduf-6 [Pristionchus pacificus]|uniref:Nduf-6 n=1 Tax=Pristionchus pacificus TaxID=54126 RepID=A0A2A6BIJ2_PRIPA|nr:nduf-6 [Pristionchus pacificus]|eukprot:PDM65611.1 nduf-6 [Pristionchus pacificus]
MLSKRILSALASTAKVSQNGMATSARNMAASGAEVSKILEERILGQETNINLEETKMPIVSSKSSPDKITHTGQGWDEKDWRLQRFDTATKVVNPNVAANLIAEKPPKDCGHERVIYCDGGHAALGHPKVFINLDKPGLHACGYCGNRFYNSHITKSPEEMAINHLNC